MDGNYGPFYVRFYHDSALDRVNGHGEIEAVEGYVCEAYWAEDTELEYVVDSFCLGVGYELANLSEEERVRAICEHLNISQEPGYSQTM